MAGRPRAPRVAGVVIPLPNELERRLVAHAAAYGCTLSDLLLDAAELHVDQLDELAGKASLDDLVEMSRRVLS